MWIFVEPARRWALPALLAALAVPVATAGVVGKDAAAPGPVAQAKANPGPAAPASPPTYQLRCWQYGRLILEEFTRDSPPESALDVVRLHDRSGGSVVLLETANATCLLKPATPASAKTPR